MRRLLFVLTLLLLSQSAFSYTLAEFKFNDPKKAEDYRALIEQMRCLVCQNESLAASNADLAQDLRKEIYEMMQSGKSKDDIVKFMVARYGDFVLYSPPVKPSTYPIWFGPLLIFLVGGVVLYLNLRKKSKTREAELSEDEQQRLDSLLKQSSDTTGKAQQ